MMRCPANPFCLCHVRDCVANGCAAQRNCGPNYRSDAVAAPEPARISRDMPGPAECRTCRHYQAGSPTAAAGTCRIKAPVVLATDGSAYWPRVTQYEWCGDHARRSVPVEA